MPDLSSAQTKYLSRLKREKYFVNISRLVLFAGFLALWEVSARIGWIDSFIFSSPSAIGLNFLDMCRNQSLFTHIGITLTETLLSFFFCSDPWNRNCSASVDVSKACKNSGALSCGTEQPAEIRPCAPSDRMAWRKCKNYHRCRYVCGDFRISDQSLYRLSGCRP